MILLYYSFQISSFAVMDVIAFSKLLIVFFVGSVTFWYVLTPYLVQPHPGIVGDV